MKPLIKLFIGIFIVVTAFIAVVTFTSLEFRSFFGTKSADIERTIFEESQSYIHGKKQEASRLYLQYQRAKTEEDKQAILSVIPIQFASFDESRHLDGDVREFIKKGKGLK